MKKNRNKVLIIGASGSVGNVIQKDFIEKKIEPILIDKINLKKKNFYKCNLNSSSKINNIFNRLFKKYPHLNILINCSGFIHSELSLNFLSQKTHNEKNLRKVFEENLLVPYMSSVIFAKKLFLSRSDGVIINFSSVNSRGVEGQSAYSASKKGIEVLTKVWAKEFSGTNIRFACISPGYMNFESTVKKTTKMRLNKVINQNPMRRLGEGSELVQAINFIIENKYFNGKTLKLDGGF